MASITPEEYKKIGYINFGYISPALSDNNTYPDYIAAAVNEAVEKIQSYQNRNSVTFGFMTDIHYSDTFNHNIRTKRLLNAYKEISKRVFSNMLLMGGDYVNDGCKEYKINNYRELRAHLDGINYYPINGNHDDNSIWDRYFIKSDNSENMLSSDELYNLFYNHLPSHQANFDEKNDGLYYYCNDSLNKIRYIFLDVCDIPKILNEKGQLKYLKQHTFAMSQKQVDWLINKALKFDEDGWEIIILAHDWPLSSFINKANNEEARLAFLNEIIYTYTKKGSLNEIYLEDEFKIRVKIDFSTYKTAKIIAVFAGHHHKDLIECTGNFPPYIITANAMMYDNVPVLREDGKKSELLFDMVTIDRKKHRIYLTRVGAGEDRIADYR